MYGYKNLFDRTIKTTAREDLEDVGVNLDNFDYIKENILGKKYYKDQQKPIASKVQFIPNNEEELEEKPELAPKVYGMSMIDSLAFTEMTLSGNVGGYVVPIGTPLKAQPQLDPLFLKKKKSK